MCKGERPIGAAKGKQTQTMTLCQHSPTSTYQAPGLWHFDHTRPLKGEGAGV